MTDSKILTRAAIPRYLVEGFLIILISSVSLVYLLLGKSITDILPVLGTVSLGAYKLLQPVQQCFSTIGNIQSNQASLEKVLRTLSYPYSPEAKEYAFFKSERLQSANSNFLNIKNMSFKYDNNNEYALQDIDLNINRGEFIAIVGPTGSGKSTLADLILGLLKPTNGNIFVNDQELHKNHEVL